MHTLPILEHDYGSEAKIEPSRVIKTRDVPDHCVISFFQEINRKVVEEKQAKVVVANRWEDGEHPIYEIDHQDKRLAFFILALVLLSQQDYWRKRLPLESRTLLSVVVAVF